jgi:alpha-ribazole phosphatase
MSSKLWLVRHAQPLVAQGVCYGATDVAAHAQATWEAAQALSKQLPRGITVLSSPLQRCSQLAGTLLELRPDLPFSHDARLVEFDFGLWEGQRWDEIPQPAWDDWTADFGNHRFGGKDSVNAILARVGAAWDAWRATGQDAVWITHAGVVRAVTLLADGRRTVDKASDWPSKPLPFGEWRVLEV